MDSKMLIVQAGRGNRGGRGPATPSKKQAALVMLGRLEGKNKTDGALGRARSGLEVCMGERDYEAAMRFAKFLEDTDAVDRVSGAWARALLECGRMADARKVSAKYALGMRFQVIMGEMEEKSKAKYGGWAHVLQEAEDAFKWGDEERVGKVMAKHSLTPADGKMLMFNLLKEACADVAEAGEELLDMPFNRYRAGYEGVTYLKHMGRLVRGISGESMDEDGMLGDMQGFLGRLGEVVGEARAQEAEKLKGEAEAATQGARERRWREDWRLQLSEWLDTRRAEVLGNGSHEGTEDI
jgi:hypothetical protein